MRHAVIIKAGKLLPINITEWVSDISRLDGQTVDIVLEARKKRRSNDANAYMWVIFTTVSAWTNRPESYAKYTKDQIHDLVLQEVGYQIMPDGRKIPRKTSAMNTLEFSQFLKAAKVFLKETFDVPYIPEPEDVYQ